VEVFDPASTRDYPGPYFTASTVLLTPLHGKSRKHRFQQHLQYCMRIRCSGNVFT
jgi:hypothetical protein